MSFTSQAKQGVELTWPYRMQPHPTDPKKLSSQQILERTLAPKAPWTRIGFGGPKGGGKSYGARAMAFKLAYLFPIVVVLIRNRLTTLKRNHILPAKNELREWLDQKIITYNEQDKIFYMPSGGMVMFMFCTVMSDVDQFEGVAGDLYIFEEAGQFQPLMITGILKNNRSSDVAINRGAGYRPRSLFTFNWGGPSHGLMRRWFWDRLFEKNEKPEKYFPLIFAPLDQNLALLNVNPEYVENLNALPEQLRRAYLKGDPDAFVGTMFIVIRQFHEVNPKTLLHNNEDELDQKIPEDWRLIGSLDAGIGAPCAFGLYAITPEDNQGRSFLYKIFTYKKVENNAPVHVDNIMQAIESCKWTKGRRPEFIVSDKYAFQSQNNMGVAGADVTWEDLFVEYSLPLYEVSYRRVTAIMALQTALHFELDDQNAEIEIKPKLQFFEGENEEIITELLAAKRSETDPEDLHKDVEDHAIDETKNMVLCSEAPPSFVPVKKKKKENRRADYGSRVDRVMELFGRGRHKDTFRNSI